MTSPSPSSAPANETFSPRVQASLFVLLIAFLGLVGWKTWQPAPSPTQVASVQGKVDLNRADRTELMLLRGVGPDTADRIVAHREKNGPFEGLGDLRRVPGIGPATLEKIRPHVVLTWPENVEPRPERGPSVVTFEPASLVVKANDVTILDPNRATLAELQTLPGIGPTLAQRIVDRRAIKAFGDVSELRKVQGIGAKTLEKIRPRLRIGDGLQ